MDPERAMKSDVLFDICFGKRQEIWEELRKCPGEMGPIFELAEKRAHMFFLLFFSQRNWREFEQKKATPVIYDGGLINCVVFSAVEFW